MIHRLRAIRPPWVYLTVLAALAVWGFALAARGRGIDFRVYLQAGQRFWVGAPLYRAADGAMPFKYAPAVAWLFAPWTLIPPALATALWNFLSVAAFALAAERAAPRLGLAPLATWAGSLTRVVAIVALVQPIFLELHYGQVDLMMLALLLFAASEERAVPAGLAVAICVLFKPPAVVMIAWLLTARRFGTAAAACGWGLALWAPVVARYGFANTYGLIAEWSETVAATTPPWVLGHNPQGLPTLLLSGFHAVAGGEPTARGVSVAHLMSLGLCALLMAVPGLSTRARLALACFGAAFASPLAWRANFVLAWPLVAVALMNPALTRPPRKDLWRPAGLAAAGVLFLLSAVCNEGVLGGERFRTVMMWRPFAWGFVLLVTIVLWGEQSAKGGAA